MNNRPGFTIEPSLMIDPATGEEFVSFDQANIINHDDRLAAIAEVQHQQQYAFHEDSEGNEYHDWDVPNGEQYDDNPNSISEIDDDDNESELSDQFIEDIYKNVGGEDAYDGLIGWASDNLSEEQIESFNAIIDSGYEDDIREAIDIIINFYNDSIDDQQQQENGYPW